MPLSKTDVTLNGVLNHSAPLEGELPLLVVKLDETTSLPPGDYVRVVALSGSASCGDATVLQRDHRKNQKGFPNASGVRAAAPDSKECPVNRHDFALHVRGARFCRLLDTMLDASAPEMAGREEAGRKRVAATATVVLPQATLPGCNALFTYLGLITTRVPSTLSKPLRAPIEELVQPWEMMFLLEHCMDEATTRVIFQEHARSGTTGNATLDGKASYYNVILNRAPMSLNILLEVAMLSDFLLVESLRQLTCAFIASLALNATSEAELLQLCGLERALTEEELGPVYAQFPFLRETE